MLASGAAEPLAPDVVDAGAATAVAGAIGFVGLVVPHLLRPTVGARPSRLLWASALGGAAMVLAADIAVRISERAGRKRARRCHKRSTKKFRFI